ncbi:hypothetical protein GCM10027169_11620 [Gordonia jinhuaensis]|uniref:ABC transporter domain-containing protein n=1 Tax=Gordonia jinhuaensis TaxID=1517702 RepID=A0A916WUN9_9ACTN|nr:ABC transporter ATP-binding protein [Gordonia jinhuaensis]GGB31441.1 hypothetical protein GCM10011489_19540 [Gordonia jinhuaensis]
MGVTIHAQGITARGPRGPVYENISFTSADGQMTIVTGPAGSGRTSLLLTIAGRWRTIAGQLRVDGLTRPREIASRVQVAQAPPAVDLDDELRVHELIEERRLFSKNRLSVADIETAMAALDVHADGDEFIHQLPAPDRVLFSVALAIAADPPAVVVDDATRNCTPDEADRVWAMLRQLNAHGCSVIASSLGAPTTATATATATATGDTTAAAQATEDGEGSTVVVALPHPRDRYSPDEPDEPDQRDQLAAPGQHGHHEQHQGHRDDEGREA